MLSDAQHWIPQYLGEWVASDDDRKPVGPPSATPRAPNNQGPPKALATTPEAPRKPKQRGRSTKDTSGAQESLERTDRNPQHTTHNTQIPTTLRRQLPSVPNEYPRHVAGAWVECECRSTRDQCRSTYPGIDVCEC